MKTLLLALLLSNFAFACPELAGEYNLCKEVKYEGQSDYAPVPEVIKIQSIEKSVYKVVEVPSELGEDIDFEYPFNPIDSFIVGETRNFTLVDEYDESIMEIKTTCTDNSLDIHVKENSYYNQNITKLSYIKTATGLKVKELTQGFFDDGTKYKVHEEYDCYSKN